PEEVCPTFPLSSSNYSESAFDHSRPFSQSRNPNPQATSGARTECSLQSLPETPETRRNASCPISSPAPQGGSNGLPQDQVCMPQDSSISDSSFSSYLHDARLMSS